jgi:hypothetical protein
MICYNMLYYIICDIFAICETLINKILILKNLINENKKLFFQKIYSNFYHMKYFNKKKKLRTHNV